MGDDDAEDLIERARKLNTAWAKLASMQATINADDSGYYEVPPTLEESLRNRTPALRDAWNQYQIILKFAKAEHYAKEENANNTRSN